MAESPENAYKGLQFTPDSYVIAGTIFEMGIPVEAPLQIAALGVKGAAKIPSGVRQAHKISKELGSAATPLQAAKQAPGKVSTSDVVTSIVQNSKVTQHVAEDASDIILAAERVEDLGPRLQGVGDKDAAVSMIADDLGPRGQVTARKLLDEPDPSLAAKEAIDDLVGKGDEAPALSAAAQDSVKLRGGGKRATERQKRFDASQGQPQVAAIDVINERSRKVQLQSRVADKLQGEAALDEFHMLTDRVAVSDDFINTKVGDKKVPMVVQLTEDVDLHFGGQLKPPSHVEGSNPVGFRTVPKDYFQAGGTPIEGMEFVPGMPKSGRDKLSVNYATLFDSQMAVDPLLNQIMQDIRKGKAISFEDEMYIRQRALEQMAFLRGAQTDKRIGSRLLNRIPILRDAKFLQRKTKTPFDSRQMDRFDQTPNLQTRDVVQVTPASDICRAPELCRYRVRSLQKQQLYQEQEEVTLVELHTQSRLLL